MEKKRRNNTIAHSITQVSSMESENAINGRSEAQTSGAVSNDPLDDGGGHEDANAVNDNVSSEPEPSDHRKDILKALEAVERDSAAIAESFSSLFSSLRQTLSQATGSTVDHMNCFSDAAGRLQECVLDASTKGNRYINSCLRVNEEMKGMEALATQLKVLRRHVDVLDSAVTRIVRLP